MGLQRESVSSEISSHQDNEFRQLLDHFGEADGLRVIKPDRKKGGLFPKKWLKVDRSGVTKLVKAEKAALMSNLGLQPRDLRLLEPQVSGSHPSAILTREKAIVVNLEAVKCICTPDYVLVFNPEDKSVVPFVERLHSFLKPKPKSKAQQLQQQLQQKQQPGDGGGGKDGVGTKAGTLGGLGKRMGFGLASMLSYSVPNLKSLDRDSTQSTRSEGDAGAGLARTSGSGAGLGDSLEQQVVAGTVMQRSEDTPFELQALEVVLDFVSEHLESLAADLDTAAHPALDTLTKQINTANLERVRRIKNKLARLSTRVETIRELLEGFLDDDSDMRNMNLTAKRAREAAEKEREEEVEKLMALEAEAEEQQRLYREAQGGSPRGDEGPDYSMAIQEMRSLSKDDALEDSDDAVEEVEMVLEPYFMRLDNTFNKLHSLTEYIDDTEDYINIELDSKRNQLIKMDLLLTSVTFAFGIISAITSLFGMNLANGKWLDMSGSYWAFCLASCLTSALAITVVMIVVLYMKKKKILHIY